MNQLKLCFIQRTLQGFRFPEVNMAYCFEVGRELFGNTDLQKKSLSHAPRPETIIWWCTPFFLHLLISGPPCTIYSTLTGRQRALTCVRWGGELQNKGYKSVISFFAPSSDSLSDSSGFEYRQVGKILPALNELKTMVNCHFDGTETQRIKFAYSTLKTDAKHKEFWNLFANITRA